MEYVGWLIIPQVAFYGRDIHIPIIRTHGNWLPIVLPTTRSGMAGRLGVTVSQLDRQIEYAANFRAVVFRGRVPTISPYLYSVCTAGVVICSTILLAIGWDRYC